jgi:hypothetical protein
MLPGTLIKMIKNNSLSFQIKIESSGNWQKRKGLSCKKMLKVGKKACLTLRFNASNVMKNTKTKKKNFSVSSVWSSTAKTVSS